MHKKICIVLTFMICFALIFTFTYASTEENESLNKIDENSNEISDNSEKTDLKTQRDLLKKQLEEANANLSDIQLDISDNLQQVQELDEKIASSEDELAKQSQKIEELKTSISEIEEKLNIVEEKYNKQKDLFEKRIVAVYEAGETHYLDILLKSRSLSDFISSYYVITEMAQIDDELLTEIEEKRNEIDLSKEKLEKQKKELAIIVENGTTTERVLQNTKKLRESFIAKLSAEELETQSKIDEYNKAYEEVNQQIIQASIGGISSEYIGGTLAWPTPGYTKINSPYAMRVHPITGVYKLHTGIDINAPYGSDFVAANDGIVSMIKDNNVSPNAYGNMVVVDHGGGISTLYAHGSQILVNVGDVVKRGQPLLKVGSTGYSTGPHAHFEVRINGVTTDPIPYITTGLVPTSEKQNTTNTVDTNTANN